MLTPLEESVLMELMRKQEKGKEAKEVSNERWVYGKNGESKIVKTSEAEDLYASGDWADHPDAFKTSEEPAEPEGVNAPEGPTTATEKMLDINNKKVSRDELVAECVRLEIDPPNKANKKELKKLIREGRVKALK